MQVGDVNNYFYRDWYCAVEQWYNSF